MEPIIYQWAAERGLGPGTVKTWGPLVSDLLATAPLHALTGPDVVAWILGSGGAPNTLRGRKRVAQSFLGWAYACQLTSVDPKVALARLQIRGGNVREGRWLSRDEALALLYAYPLTLKGLRDRTLTGVMLLTGLRSFEARKMQWGDLDLRNGRLRVTGKRGKRSEIGLPEQATRWLREWSDHTGSGMKPSWYVFPTGHGREDCYAFDWAKPMTDKTLATLLSEASHRAGLGHVCPHDLRRTFAGWLDGDDVDLRGIQAALRHESPQTTVRHYLSKDPGRAVRAVQQLRI